MAGRTITRADLGEAVRREVGLSRTESDDLVRAVIDGVADALVAGEPVKLSGFGNFVVRRKGERVGRNPKTGVEVQITPRRVLAFRPSQVIKVRINSSGGDHVQS